MRSTSDTVNDIHLAVHSCMPMMYLDFAKLCYNIPEVLQRPRIVAPDRMVLR